MIDTIIIGVGPAGISAALNLRKINRSVLVLGKDKGQLSNLDVIDNLYGQGPIAGEQLITKGIKEARHLGIEIKNELVLNVAQSKDFFVVTTNKESYASKTVVLATGKPRIPLDIEGYQQFKSKGIHLCATCDGLLYKNKKIGIIGAGPYLMQELSTLENYTNDITIFTNGKPFSHDKYLVITDEVTAFLGEKRLTHLKTVNNTYPLSGTFLAINYPMAAELSLKLGIIMDDDNIEVDTLMQTNIPGLFAAGDCVGGLLQIPKAIYDGLKVAQGVNKFLKGETNL